MGRAYLILLGLEPKKIPLLILLAEKQGDSKENKQMTPHIYSTPKRPQLQQTKCIKIFTASGKVCGKVCGDTWHKTIHGNKHFLQRPPAIAFDLKSLEQVEHVGARRVVVVDQENGTTYTASLARLRESGFEFDRGHGRQVALPLSGWTITRCGEIPARQLDLWQVGKL